jgi:hypothetical protein
LDEMLQKLFFFFLFFSQEEEDDHESWFCLFFKLQQYLLAGFSAKLSCFDDNVNCLIWVQVLYWIRRKGSENWLLICLIEKKPFCFCVFGRKNNDNNILYLNSWPFPNMNFTSLKPSWLFVVSRKWLPDDHFW